MSDRIDFARVAKDALQRSEQLVPLWLPDGAKVGHEWKSVNPTRSDSHAGSFSINLNTGAWGDFATGDKGGDLVSLLAYLFHAGDQVAAVRELAELLGIPDAVPAPKKGKPKKAERKAPVLPADAKPPKPKAPVVAWEPVVPVPADAPPPPAAHEFRGIPTVRWTYRDQAGEVLGYVCRFVKSDGSKEVLPLTFCRHPGTGLTCWRWITWEVPRPLYGLDRLAARPDAPVLLVEGEKCVDAAVPALPEFVPACWSGGSNAVFKADWSALAGRTVLIWPDCDAQHEKLTPVEKAAGIDPKSKPLLPETKQPGVKAAESIAAVLLALSPPAKVRIVAIPAPGEKPAGWDIADALEEGWSAEDLKAFMRRQRHAQAEMSAVPSAPAAASIPASVLASLQAAPPAVKASDAIIAAAGEGGAPPPVDGQGGDDEPPDKDWALGLLRKKGEISACLANAELILAHMDEWQGVIGYDEFAERTVHRAALPCDKRGPSYGDWVDHLDATVAIHLQRQWEVEFSPATVGQAVEVLARRRRFHPVREALAALPPWDGRRRNAYWLSDFLGVAPSPYVELVGAFFLRGMVKRVMEPGCKFDYCLVLEGEQGKGKSTAAKLLSWQWFADTDLDLNNKDSLLALPGHWVYEISEMGSLMKAEERKQKSFLSRQWDEYRPPYGKRLVKVPRQCVFVGTTNEDEYLKDATGGRRFWPVMCGDELNLEGLEAALPQMYAEALHDYREAERCWPTKEEQDRYFTPEQAARGMPEPFEDILGEWVSKQGTPFSMADAAMAGLNLTADKLTPAVVTRLGIVLTKRLGCTKREDRNAPPGRRRLYLSPSLAAKQGGKPLPRAAAPAVDDDVQGGAGGYF
ncbi:hypothetical protein GPA19_08090 [Azoarcus indigens]|uniref:Virulence-associated protein E n=1 Tax=Azoarcus indigens TaxID=29545 RepID=A0A4V3BMF3_9RHOO|nr:VapE domain-containing protein [Azoarcus indigens]NMG64904.1 hypothetical protein [Azoarcus indigens]TDN50442.1 virulence-associated protein E [Azoarcus indigens]